MDAFQILEEFYNLEQNVEITSFFDAGWTFALGTKAYGYTAQLDTYSLREGFEWLEKELEKLKLFELTRKKR